MSVGFGGFSVHSFDHICYNCLHEGYSVLQAADYLEDDLTVSSAASDLAEELFNGPRGKPEVSSEVCPAHAHPFSAQKSCALLQFSHTSLLTPISGYATAVRLRP